MLFNSFEFLFFLPVVFILYWFVCGRSLRAQNLLLLAASYFFYGWWSWTFASLLALSTLLDYIYGFSVASPNRKKAKVFLWLSIINNLGILAVFKYYNFFAAELQALLESAGLHANPVLLQVALPVGISFYTFHGMSYVFDIYRNKQKPVSDLVDYAVFVGFFPLLVAGPIERAHHLLPQVRKPRTFRYAQATEGCRLILWGMFKKVVIADRLGLTADLIFNDPQSYNAGTLLIGAVAFSFQIYCDFSGYSDIALGTAKLFGFELLSNFRFPYFSRNVGEFWKRWHISLSSWFRDYLYIPLGGSRNGTAMTIRNIFIVFLVSGFWHGANLTFLAWGFIHACGFLPLLLLNRSKRYVKDVVAEDRLLPSLRELAQMMATFMFVTLAWIFFRARDLTTAFNYLERIFEGLILQPGQLLQVEYAAIFIYIVPLVAADWWLRHDERKLRVFRSPVLRIILYIMLALLTWLYFGKWEADFIYFQF